MPNRRFPREFTPNEITTLLESKRRSGVRILDLTESNPTKVGLGGAGSEELRALADPRGGMYAPDPNGMLEARQAIAGYYEERTSRVSPDNLVLVASTSEAYAHLLRLLCNPGDEIVVPRPSYPLFEALAALEDVAVERYRLTYHDGWHLDRDSLDAALSPRTRAVVLVQPNNPTGSCLSPEELAEVESLCAGRGIALISDEVFGDFPWPPSTKPLPSMAGDRSALTFVLAGLSKLCGMPQMKLAWIAVTGPDATRRDAIRRLEWISDLFLSVSTPVQLALPKLLLARHRFQSDARRRLETNLALLRSLGNGGSSLRVLEGEGGWSAVLATSSRSEDPALDALEKHNVLIHPGHFYDLAQDGTVVVSLLTEPRVFEEGIRLLEDVT